ncbi:hypothetical protein LTR37_018861 [Vermiconidia calcicola]|uniref:Uncharacterized protein n=1 Tax=Vermiconidia calcicola TaxID=1690605 RepID=A0ACC3MFS7_9PEZI|nr:hypothetical protein LTR37_018861 [Vermiconidia calcicola]
MAALEGGVGPKQFLDLNDDVLYQICLAADQDENTFWYAPTSRDVVALCSTCKRIREIGTPLVFGKTFELDVLAPTGGYYCTKDLVRALSLCALPYLKRLVTTPGLEGLISRFNSVVHLEIKGEFNRQIRTSQSLHQLANQGKLRGLSHLRLTPLEPMTTRERGWSPKVLEDLSTGTPQLRSLGVIGGHALGYSFESLLRAPDLFPCLEELTVDTLTHLGLCEMGQDCDLSLNPCKPPRWFCQYHIRDAIRYASRVAFTALPQLEVLNFSNEERTMCIREDDGSIANIVIDDQRVKELTVEHTFDTSEESVWEAFLSGP